MRLNERISWGGIHEKPTARGLTARLCQNIKGVLKIIIPNSSVWRDQRFARSAGLITR
jgi:hypothetical protein